jgi:hypothetical protein
MLILGPYSRTRPRSRAAYGLFVLSMRRGLWPRRYMPSSISIRTPERLLVQHVISNLLPRAQIRLRRALD